MMYYLQLYDMITLRKATHGQYLVAASSYLGYFELAFVRARRNCLNMEEDLLTPRCGVRPHLNCNGTGLHTVKGSPLQEVVVMYIQNIPFKGLRIVPSKHVWLPFELLEKTYTSLRHIIATLTAFKLLLSPALPQREECVNSCSQNQIATFLSSGCPLAALEYQTSKPSYGVA
jgi:hypothetical protein